MSVHFDNTAIAFRSQTDKTLKHAHVLFSLLASSLFTKIGMALVRVSFAVHLPVKWAIKNTIFRQFCGGETLKETAVVAARLGQYHVDTILDYGVEGKDSESAFDSAVPEFIEAIKFAATQKHIPFISLKITGFARFALLEKLHSGLPATVAEKEEWESVCDRIDKVCSCASENHVKVLIDAEETWIQNPCNEITEAMMEKYNRERAVVFNTFQLYCSGTLNFLRSSIEHASSSGYVLGAKLVRGAYMEKERSRAREKGYADPIQPDKATTDHDFDRAVDICMANLDKLEVFIGTHNELSCRKTVELMGQMHIPAAEVRVSFSQLLGMGDHISFNLADKGYRVSKYVPYGPVADVVPYLMRRAQENTSVAGQTNRELALIRKELSRRHNCTNPNGN